MSTSQSTSANQNYTGQTVNQTIYINGSAAVNPQITIARVPFFLERHDFETLLKADVSSITNALIGSTIALFINLIGKLVGNKFNPTIHFDEWEFYSFAISMLLMLLFLAIGHFRTSTKKEIVTKIKEHFKNN